MLFVTHSFPRYEGDAAGSFLLRLAQALRDEQVEVTVLAPSGADPTGAQLSADETVAGVRVRRFRYAPRTWETLAYTGTMVESVTGSTRGKLALGGLLTAERRAAVRAVRDARADLVHAHWWFPNGIAAVGAARAARVPLVTTSHGTDLRLLEKTGGAAPLARYVFTRSAAVTCVSGWLAGIARPFTRDEPIVAPMPAETDLFVPGGERIAGRLLFVGRLTEQKGIAHAIEALARMREPATLDVVGDGPLADALARLVSRLGIEGRVRFHASVRHEELVDMYRSATALVAPSVGEGLGLVAVEAQLCETPVVAFASGGIVDVVRDDRTGLLVAPGDVDALARALDRIVADGALARRLGATGREAALERFTPDAAARAYAAIYRGALDQDGRHAA